MAETIPVIISLVMFLGGVGIFIYGFKILKKVKIIQNTPRSKIRSMAMGLVEIHGTAKAKEFLIAPFSKLKCIYYKYVIKEYRRHTSGSGDNKRTTYRWDTVATGERRIPFTATDETGNVDVNPSGAEFNIDPKKVFLQKAGLIGAFNVISSALKNFDNNPNNDVDISKWNLTELDPKKDRTFMNTVGDRKYYEYFLQDNETLFVLGTAANEASKISIKKGVNEPTFIISDKSEKDLLKNMKFKMIGFLLGGFILSIIGLVILLRLFELL